MPTVNVSEYWFQWLKRVVDTGIRHSMSQIVAEALAKAHNGAAHCSSLMQRAARIWFSCPHKIYSIIALLVRHRRLIDNEAEEYLQVKQEMKERREAMK